MTYDLNLSSHWKLLSQSGRCSVHLCGTDIIHITGTGSCDLDFKNRIASIRGFSIRYCYLCAVKIQNVCCLTPSLDLVWICIKLRPCLLDIFLCKQKLFHKSKPRGEKESFEDLQWTIDLCPWSCSSLTLEGQDSISVWNLYIRTYHISDVFNQYHSQNYGHPRTHTLGPIKDLSFHNASEHSNFR